MTAPLLGKVVVVPVEWAGAESLATRMAAEGATVVLVAVDGEAAGRLAAKLESSGAGRPAIFLADGSAESLDTLAAFLSELFRSSETGRSS